MSLFHRHTRADIVEEESRTSRAAVLDRLDQAAADSRSAIEENQLLMQDLLQLQAKRVDRAGEKGRTK